MYNYSSCKRIGIKGVKGIRRVGIKGVEGVKGIRIGVKMRGERSLRASW
jgi:hypothetical protein